MRRGRDERGAVLVETAILIPVIILITFGLIEFSSAYQASSVAASAVRSAGRTASAEPRVSTYAADAAAAAATALKGVPADEPVELWVYKADANGMPPSGNFTTCTTNCYKYTWNSSTKAFNTTPSGSGWASSTQNACPSTSAGSWDSVGVWVKLNHKFLTKLFGANITLTDRSTFRLEPAPTLSC